MKKIFLFLLLPVFLWGQSVTDIRVMKSPPRKIMVNGKIYAYEWDLYEYSGKKKLRHHIFWTNPSVNTVHKLKKLYLMEVNRGTGLNKQNH